VLQKTLVWLQKREDRLREMGQVPANFDDIKQHWGKIKVGGFTVKNNGTPNKTVMFRWVYSKVVKKGASAWNDHHFVLLLSVHRTNTNNIQFYGRKISWFDDDRHVLDT